MIRKSSGSPTTAIIALVIQSSVYAAPIMRIDGTGFGFQLQSPNPNDTIFDRLSVGPVNGVANKFDNVPVGPFPVTLLDFDVSRTGNTVTSVSGKSFTEFAVSQATPDNLGTLKRIFNLPSAAHPNDAQANFQLSMLIALVPVAAPNTLIIEGKEMLIPNPVGQPVSTFDFSMLQFFSLTLVGPAGADFANTIKTGGTLGGGPAGGSFFQSTSAADSELLKSPEPNALSLTLIGLAGLWFVRRIRTAGRDPV